MSVKSFKTGTRTFSMLAGNVPEHHVLIAETTVGSGGASSVTFSDIPQSYQHLQIRVLCNTSGGVWDLLLRMGNGSIDTGNNYSTHRIGGYGTGLFADATTSASSIKTGLIDPSTSYFSVSIIDMLDYTSISKNKTVRSLAGYDNNGGGYVLLTSGLWMNTGAVNTVRLLPSTNSFLQHSTFQLYGVK